LFGASEIFVRKRGVKVLVEHRRRLTVVLYLPWKRKLLGGDSELIRIRGDAPLAAEWHDV
jgi:hypothetical protein